jgi:hypothetical protein
MSQLTLPKTEDIGQFFTTLYGLTISATECDPLTDSELYAVATFVNGQGEPTAAIKTDIEGAAKLAAALTQIPAGGVEDAIKEGSLTPILQDNLSEVFNILANLFPGNNEMQLTFDNAIFGATEAPSYETSMCLSLDIQRYDKGRIELSF